MGGCEPGRVDHTALQSTATVWYESTAAPRFGAASIRILTPGGAATGGSVVRRDAERSIAEGRAQLRGVEAGGAANIRMNPVGEGIGGRLTDSCSVLLSRAQTRRSKALDGAREAMSHAANPARFKLACYMWEGYRRHTGPDLDTGGSGSKAGRD